MAATRFEIEKFDGETNLNLWQVLIMPILVQTGLKKVVTGKRPEILNQTEWEEFDEKFLPAIQLCIVNTVLQEVLMEKTLSVLWKRDKLDNEFGLDNKADKQASVLVASKKRDKKCLYCKKLGHVKVDCYKLQNKRAAKRNEENVAGANLANESSDDFLLMSTSDNSKLTFEWILDSRCSFHMCSNREWFSTYSSVESGVVRMGNDSSSKRTDSLYIPEGSTMIDEIGCPSSVTESKSTRLEWRQLGYRRENCMTISLKRGSFLDAGFEKKIRNLEFATSPYHVKKRSRNFTFKR
ncbi:hypothetical protein J1N35_025729 [Gossypium stocksii]|uniref:Retrovirus-related Pol polyprotein from transposon TNT 1-94-like beta-barrel domain-containing protein n=1 Tax=Gossypium stocksii TaxID=47602 RepID=A0A9D3V8E7_9ROSI|nr:hypothetical protein J1N35_025729 [Gossypium stocksii]